MLNDRNSLVIISIFFTFFIFCLFIVDDYGVSQDEYANRIHGFVTLRYLGELIFPEFTNSVIGNKNIPLLNTDYVGKSYGSYYSAFHGILEVIFNVKDKYNQFLLRHYFNFIIYFVSLIFFYKTLLVITENKYVSLIGFLFLALTPRIFANSFYNNIDIFFLSIVIISSYFFLKFYLNQNYKNLLLCSLFTALIVDHRIAGIYFLFQNSMFIFLFAQNENKNYGKKIYYIFLYFFSSLIFIYLFWPFLWTNPINNFLIAFQEMSKWDYIIQSFFNGKFYLSSSVPKYYTLQWIFITTPILFIIFFLIGLFFILKNSLRNYNSFTRHFIMYLYFFFVILGHVFVIIFFQPNLYNGWRHFYYLYPSIVILAIYGLNSLIIKNNKLRPFIFFISIIKILYLLNWNFDNHPNQQVFFNSFADKDFNRKFDMDYWALSNKEQLNKILEIDKRKKIEIYNLSENKLFYSLFSLKEDERKRFNIVNSIDKADYVITNYYIFDEKQKKELSLLNKFLSYNDITVDDVIISSLYKNQKKNNISK